MDLDIAVPWSLNHYIPLNGFHPLYRALFEEQHESIIIHAWDLVKLHQTITSNKKFRASLLKAMRTQEKFLNSHACHSVTKDYYDYFGLQNPALTGQLPGDIEFHHTALFPSMSRPFVFHCESFAPIFFPFNQAQLQDDAQQKSIIEHYGSILSSPLCLGIFSHIPETLQHIQQFFQCPIISNKLHLSEIGLSSVSLQQKNVTKLPLSSNPQFLFVNSANQNPNNFFTRGGAVVLHFWKNFITQSQQGLLIMRCTKPSQESLLQHGIDLKFLQSEEGKSICWIENYITHHELCTLMARSHFFLLPSVDLHSVSIMQAMHLGALPIVSDTLGTSLYVDAQEGIVLEGVRDAVWKKSTLIDIPFNTNQMPSSLTLSLATQLTQNIFELLKKPEYYEQLRAATKDRAQKKFNGHHFATNFWAQVQTLYKKYLTEHPTKKTSPALNKHALTLEASRWPHVFESPTQPVQKIITGTHIVVEYGGVYTVAEPKAMALSAWSSIAHYYNSNNTLLSINYNLQSLNGCYLPAPPEQFITYSSTNCLLILLKVILKPFPSIRQQLKNYWHLFNLYKKHSKLKQEEPNLATPIVLIGEYSTEKQTFNILQYLHRYYAIPQGEGAFFFKKIIQKEYSVTFSSMDLNHLYKKMALYNRRLVFLKMINQLPLVLLTKRFIKIIFQKKYRHS